MFLLQCSCFTQIVFLLYTACVFFLQVSNSYLEEQLRQAQVQALQSLSSTLILNSCCLLFCLGTHATTPVVTKYTTNTGLLDKSLVLQYSCGRTIFW